MYPTEHTSLSGVALVLITNVACSRNALLTILLSQVLPLPQPPLCEFTIAPAGFRGEWSAESAHGSPS